MGATFEPRFLFVLLDRIARLVSFFAFGGLFLPHHSLCSYYSAFVIATFADSGPFLNPKSHPPSFLYQHVPFPLVLAVVPCFSPSCVRFRHKAPRL